MTDEVRKLLGGYATGTLTDEERALLFEAALDDAALFEALADEQSVRDLLDDSGARAELLAAVQDRPFSIAGVLSDWFERPKSKVMVALAAVTLVAIGVRESKDRWSTEHRDVVAVLRPPQSPQPQSRQPQSAPPPQQQPSQVAQAPRNKDSNRAETRTFSEPPAAAPVVASPPQAAVTAADVQGVETAVLSWSVLRVDSRGVATPVDRSYAFEGGEKARIRVDSVQSGMLLAKQGEEVLYAGTISPGLPVVLRRDIPISESGDVPAIDLEWAPAPVAPMAAAAPPPPPPSQAAPARRQMRQAAPEGGVVGGVIGGVPPGESMGFREGNTIPMMSAVQVPGRSRVRVQLQRKTR